MVRGRGEMPEPAGRGCSGPCSHAAARTWCPSKPLTDRIQRMNLFVTGTDTGVGKTVVTAGLTRALRDRGEAAAPYKPVETGTEEAPDAGRPSDALFLAEAAGWGDPTDAVTETYREPLAPLVAARREERPVDPDLLDAHFRYLDDAHDHVLVEGAGGLSVPVTGELDMAGLAGRWDLPVLVVVRPALGTLNHSFLTVRYARARGLPVVGLLICGYHPGTEDVAERTNPSVLEEMCEVPVLGKIRRRPRIETPEEAAEALEAAVDPSDLIERCQQTVS